MNLGEEIPPPPPLLNHPVQNGHEEVVANEKKPLKETSLSYRIYAAARDGLHTTV